VSTAEQVEHGSSLDAQETILRDEAVRRGWDIEVVREEGRSAKNLTGRPLLTDALERLDAGAADVLLAVRLDRVSRSTRDFADMLDRAGRRGWALMLLGSNVDTSDPNGEMLLGLLAVFAQYERRLISTRVKEGLAQREAEGWAPTARNPEGRRPGRPRLLAADTVRRIRTDHASGISLNRIAAALNEEDVPTATGGRWHASTIKAVIESKSLAADPLG
jgi:DNA invertase Pin-like site-specific DNA recombinase